jgi:formylglycine-generating enzyme required for sulfatase activity
MPSDPPRPIAKGPDDATGTSPAGLSGISKLFGLEGRRPEETATAAASPPSDTASPPSDTTDQWSAATEGTASGLADASGRMVHGRYRLIAELASGGMGITYRAWDTNVGLPVVVKMPKREVRRDREAMARFAREIEAMRAVPHESIVPITDSGDDEGCPFVAMRFLPGGSLADYRRWDDAGAPIKNQPGMLHFWLPGVAAALDQIHAKGLLHRDVKPGNIFLDAFLRPFLGDFGIAKVVDDSGGLAREATLTATQMAVGTPEYMAPELFKPRVQLDGRVDEYALAVTVYEMLCGEKPFTGSTAHIIVEHSSLPVPQLERRCPGLPRSVYEAVHRALAKKPEERFSTCGEFAAAVLTELKPVGLEAGVARLLCPGCRNILKLPRRAAGRSGRCPRCKAAMDVAADLGSLWLEAEERGGAYDKPFTAVEMELRTGQELPSENGDRASRPQRGRWGAREWTAIAVALGCGLAIGYPGGSLVATSQANAKLTAENGTLLGELAAASKAREALQKTVEANAKLTAENVRLTQELTAASTYLQRATKSIGIELIKIPKGSFMMGDGGEVRVTLSRDFWLARTEVTRGQWEELMGTTPWGRLTRSGSTRNTDADLPAVNVSWDDATEFCRKLTERERASGQLQGEEVYRLPTEAEWEYACRAGTTTEFSFGYEESKLGDFGWFSGNSGSNAHPVGTRNPNPWGLCDMHGNVWEWCSDWYAANLAGGVDPAGPAGGSYRVNRGGGWATDPVYCRSAIRDDDYPSLRDDYLGFRVARSQSVK